jgi:hypothetical protein
MGTSGTALLIGMLSSAAAPTPGCCLLLPCTRLQSMDMLRCINMGRPARGASTEREQHGFCWLGAAVQC